MSDERVVPLHPAPEVSSEERARRLQAEVERLARLSAGEWMLYVVGTEGYAERYGVDKATLKQMVEAVIKESAKKVREEKAERERIEERAEKQRTAKEREEERKADKQERLDRQAKKEADKRAEKQERERQKELGVIAKLPRAEHEAKLQQLARRLGERIEDLRTELELLLADAEAAVVREAAEPWPEPVDTKQLLDETLALLRCYVVVHDEASATIYALTVPFAWIHDAVATFSPILVVQGPDSDAGKTLLCLVHKLLTPRSLMVVKPTGPSIFRLIDHRRPTLYIDNGDKLLAEDQDLATVINSSWTRGIPVPRVNNRTGEVSEFDIFAFKVVNGVDVLPHMDPATRTRCIPTEMLPKLADEKVTHFKHAAGDERFPVLRRKWMRWAADNAVAIRDATPVMPAELNNRSAENYAVLVAIADLAGGDWPKRIRTAAIKLARAHNVPSLRRRLLAKFFEFFAAHGSLLPSQQVVALLKASGEEEWTDYLGRGRLITAYQVAHLLRPRISPGIIHPRGRAADRGYDAADFATDFKHFLGKTLPAGRTVVRKGEGKRKR